MLSDIRVRTATRTQVRTAARTRVLTDYLESKSLLISDTPFEDGTFRLTIEFTEEYPNKPPTVKFVSKMFHPNVYSDGSLCLDILQNR